MCWGGQLVCLREAYMVVHWWRGVDVGQHEFMDIESMPIMKKETGENDCLSGNWKGLGSYVLVLKQENYNMVMMYTYSRIVVCECQK